MIKKIAIIFLSSILFNIAAFAEISPLEKSIRNFGINSDDLYLLAISAVQKNKFEIVETQSNKGLTLFKSGENEYLMSVTEGMVKILPANSDFSTGFSVQEKIFKTIGENIKK